MDFVHLDFQQAKAKHLQFKSRLRAILYDEIIADEAPVVSHYECPVGKWIYGHALSNYGHIPELQELEQTHAEIHTVAKKLVHLYKGGHALEARRGLQEMEVVADKLVGLLSVVEAKTLVPSGGEESKQDDAFFDDDFERLQELYQKNEELDRKIKAQSEAFVKQQAFFQNLLAASPVILWMSNVDGLITYMNPTWYYWNGNVPGKHLATTWMDTIYNEDRELVIMQYRKDFAARLKFEMEHRIVLKDVKWCLTTGQPCYDSENNFTGYVGSITDITERKLIEQALHHKTETARQVLHNFFMQAPAIFCILRGSNHVFELTNPGYKQLFGQRDIIGLTVKEALPEVEGQGFIDLLDRVFTTQEPYIGKEVPLAIDKGKGIENVILTFIYQPIINSNNETDGILVYANEVTEQVQARMVLEKSAEELEKKVAQRTNELVEVNYNLKRSNDELSQFAYVASHDLQEPLRKIITFCNRLNDKFSGALPSGADDYVIKISTSAKKMSQLINDILNYSSITKAATLHPTDLNEVLKELMIDFNEELSLTGATITYDTLPVISAIPMQMTQLFHNLLSNALKFSKENVPPVITITSKPVTSLEVKETRMLIAHQAYTEIIFSDNGIGFEQKYDEQIFTIFQRLHGKSAYPGTGIGLALCKKIVENHGGAIYVRSDEDEGTDFHIILPVD